MGLFNKKFIFFTLITTLFSFPIVSHAQKIDTLSTFSITAYVDAYYAHYTDSVGAGNFQKFPGVSPRNDNPSLNTAMASFLYNTDKIRATAVFHFGDIAAAGWPAQPYNHIMEAHVGVKIYSKLWIDAGFFRGHFGTEFLLPSENITSSLAVGTYYEPFYESGVKLNFDPTQKLEINLFLLNGYNVFIDNNGKKSFGMGVTYALWDNGGLGYTNYIGDETPDGVNTNHLRVHQNLFFNYQHKKFKLQVGGDYCMQQNSDITTGAKMATMYSALATLRYQCLKKLGVYARGEVLSDPQGYMTGIVTDYTGTKTGLKLWGVTGGVEYKPTDESYVKVESRFLQMDKNQYIFINDGTSRNYRLEIMVTAGVTFDILKTLRTRLVEPKDNTAVDGIK